MDMRAMNRRDDKPQVPADEPALTPFNEMFHAIWMILVTLYTIITYMHTYIGIGLWEIK